MPLLDFWYNMPPNTRGNILRVGGLALLVAALAVGCSSLRSGFSGGRSPTQVNQQGCMPVGPRYSHCNIGGAEFVATRDPDGSYRVVLDEVEDPYQRDVDPTGYGRPGVRVEDPDAVLTVHSLRTGKGRVVAQKRGSPVRP